MGLCVQYDTLQSLRIAVIICATRTLVKTQDAELYYTRRMHATLRSSCAEQFAAANIRSASGLETLAVIGGGPKFG